MDSPPSLSEGRKRSRRPPKATQSKQSTDATEFTDEGSLQQTSDLLDCTESPVSRVENENLMEIDGAVLAISPPSLTKVAVDAGNQRAAAIPTTSSECRRSSRKKIIKFDVRDLLNKHRKPHKIQIEARIDSNAPQTQKNTSTASIGASSNPGQTASSSTTDLSSKQKAFMEKSAIFRRISISEQQSKINTPPLLPPLSAMPKVSMLGKNPINLKSNVDSITSLDPAKIAQASRLSRTQEIFNASLLKSKQNSSLIVAQIESKTSSSSSVFMGPTVLTPPQQKKGTTVSSKLKNTSNAFVLPTPMADAKSSTPEFVAQKRRGRPPKSKTAVTQNPSTKANQKSAIKANEAIDEAIAKQPNRPTANYTNKKREEKQNISKPTSNTATNWQEYKASLNRASNLSSSSESLSSFTQKQQTHTDDLVLEISSTSSVSELEFQTVTTHSTTDVHESQQRNFASVCILQESPSICETISAPEFIVAAVEEITTDNTATDKSISLETGADAILQKPVEPDLDKTVGTKSDTTTMSEGNIKPGGSRKSSGSESESGSDRSNKSYKSGDKLRVSLKRLTMPQRRSSPSSASSSCSDIIVSSNTTSSNSNKINRDDSSSPTAKSTTPTELSTVTLSRNLPTRRSHRLPKRTLDRKIAAEESKTSLEIISNENINETAVQQEMSENKAEENNTRPVENKTLNTVKTVSEVELTKEENKIITSTTVENIALETSEEIVGTELENPKMFTEELLSVSNEPKIIASKTKDVAVELPKRQQVTANFENLPSTSKGSKRGGITLPLKKQVSKFKMYEEALHNVAANVETSTLLDILNTVKQNDITLATKTVQSNVEKNSAELFFSTDRSESPANICKDDTTSDGLTANKTDEADDYIPAKTFTLHDKELATNARRNANDDLIDEMAFQDVLSCESSPNDKSKQSQSLVENIDSSKESLDINLTTSPMEEKKAEENITVTVELKTDDKTINVCHEPTVATDEVTSNVLEMSEKSERQDICHKREHALDESSSEEINSTSDSQSSRDELTKTVKKTPSPSFSDSSSNKASRMLPSRRNERRSRRGETAGHKTLEETFAEIAAQSSKAVLESKARNELNEDVPENVSEKVLEDATNTCVHQVEITENVDVNEEAVQITAWDGSAKSMESKNQAIDMTEIVECDVISNVENTIEVTTCESPSPTVECSVPKVTILQEDTDSNSNNSSPSRQGRKSRNKRAVTESPQKKATITTSDTLRQNAQTTIETQAFEATNVLIAHSILESNISNTLETSILQEIKMKQDQVSDTAESSNILPENSDATLPDLPAVETVVEITTEQIAEPAVSFANVSEIGLVVEVTDISHTSADTTISDSQMTDFEISNTSIDTTTNITSPNIKDTKESKKQTATKTRNQKKGANSRAQKSANVEFVEKLEEPFKKSMQSVGTESEKPMESSVEKVMETTQESMQTASSNLSLSNNDSIVESKCFPDISNETSVQNVPLPEECEQPAVPAQPAEKPKKVRKRKSTKQLSEEKIVDTKPETPLETKPLSASAEVRPIEPKEQANDPADDAAKTRKSRKGKTANVEPISDHSTEVPNVETNSSALEPVEKECLSKAPPKKRLLKMQMELEDKSNTPTMELSSTSSASVDTKAATAKKSTMDNGKSKDSTSKKSKRELQTSDDLKDKASFDGQMETSIEEQSHSASSTPVAKRSKHKKGLEKTPEHKSKSSGKRKSKMDQTCGSNDKIDAKADDNKEKERSSSATKKSEKKKEFLANEEIASNELSKKMEEKNAKKKRQKKLKEAFEAALKDASVKSEATAELTVESTSTSENIAAMVEEKEKLPDQLTAASTATSVEEKQIIAPETEVENLPQTPAMNEPEEEPDPLKDIEKFIEDGVNLLKRGYKIDDDSVDEVLCSKSLLQKEEENKPELVSREEQTTPPLVEGMTTPNESIMGDVTPAEKSFEEANNTLTQNIYYETPADTPVATPTTTPPPKSPIHESPIDEITGVRRSHRIKQITKTPKALVGRGLVREKERFSIKDDVEMKTHYSLDDHLTDLAQVEAKNAKFLKEMEERLSNFQVIKENEYKCERVISREARKMLCDCFLTAEEEERGELGCGEDCLNRLLMIECGPDCNVKVRCTNKRFQKLLCSPCRVFRTEKKGFGIMADIEILPGEFIMEYVGEVIDGDQFEQRRTAYSLDKNRHYYFMALRSDAIIDATIKGNISRFINHSCDPNAETQKWTVNGELRIGFFSRKSIMPGEEITFDYQYQRYGREAQRCYCESANCRGWIGEEPNSDEGEQIDDDSDADNLADGSDEEDSDDSYEDAHKKAEAMANKSVSVEEDGKIKDSAIKDKKKKLGEDVDDDLKAKLKKLSGKSADKTARRKKQNKEKKEKRLRKVGAGEQAKASRYLEDPDIEDEVKFLSRGGLRNQSDTLRFSRLVVRAKLPQTRLNLLKILRNGELPCRRLFLDYHGLRLLHGWMSEDGGDMAIRLSLLEALESLPIANKTVLTDSKVYQTVRNWCGNALPPSSAPAGSSASPSDESSKESTSSNSQQELATGEEVPSELQKLALKLTSAWNSLPEIFRIPKRERIEQMKEHEREADRQFAESSLDTNRSIIHDRYQRNRFGRGPTTSRYSKPSFGKDSRNHNITVVGSTTVGDPRRRSTQDNSANNEGMKHLSKEQRREMFAAKVARDEAEKRLAEERREFETKCRFFGLDPKKTRTQDVPFCVDPSTGQWYSVARQPIPTPPCYAHIQVQPKPKSTDPEDYKLPAVIATFPRQWNYAITPLGQIYYYHVKHRVPQWHPPTPEQLRAADEEADSSDSESCEEAKIINESSEEDDVLIGMDEAQLRAFIDKKVEKRRHKRYSRLVDERPISPRKEEDRIYNQIEMRKYKENKEKIRKRKEEIRRKRTEALKAATLGGISPNTLAESLNAELSSSKVKNGDDSDEPDGAIPIQDYLLSSDEEEIMKEECNNSPLLEKIVQGDKIVDELDALTTKRSLKRPLPPHRDLNAQPVQSSGTSSGVSSGGSEHKRRKSDKKEKSKKSKDSDSKYRRNKEKFRCEIAGIIVQHLKPYRKESCILGRIQCDEDFNHLARKLTHFVMVKELKYCESVGQTLVVTESVKNKSREFIKKYMAKYGGAYVKPANDPEFKDIPFTI